jgi:hypothetical protein
MQKAWNEKTIENISEKYCAVSDKKKKKIPA